MFKIIKRIFLGHIRYPKNLLFNMLFPIFLMTLIGFVLINQFDTSNQIENFTVYYNNDSGSKESNQLLDEIIKNNKTEIIYFEKTDSIDKGKDIVRKSRGSFIYLDGNTIKLYSNEKNKIESGIVSGLFKTVSNRFNAITEVYKINDENAINIINDKLEEDYINVEKVEKTQSPTSFDYYGIAELTLMSMYILFFSLYGIQRDDRLSVKDRILLTKFSIEKYYLANIIGNFMLSIIITLPGYLFSIFVLKTNWGNNLIISFLILLSLNLMVVTMGTFLGVIFKDNGNASAFIDRVIFPVMSFLGGSYLAFPDKLPTVMQIATNISPLRWINRGFFRMIYLHDNSIITISVALNLGITIIALILLTVFVKKESVE